MRMRSLLAAAAAGGIVMTGLAAPGEAAVRDGTISGTAAAPAWAGAIPLPGLSALDRGQPADPEALSCAAAGDCAIGGSYTDAAGRTQAFVAAERSGVWGAATEVPGSAALNRGGNAVVTSVSCPAPGDCAAVGQYSPGGQAAGGTGAPSAAAFVVVERNGAWGAATPLRGLAARNKGRSAGAARVSCWSPGDCTVVGTYAAGARGRDLITQAFVAGERNGVWGAAVPLPGLVSLNTAGQAQVTALSCAPARAGVHGTTAARRAAAGDCAVGGKYGDRAGTEAFTADEVRGAWHRAREFPGTAARNTAGAAGISALSCPVAGDCAVAGSYAYKTGHGSESGTGFVADSRAWKWSAPHAVPGTGDVVSCGSPGNCEAGGTSFPDRGSGAFIADETRGTWAGPRSVPGLAGPGADVIAISCPSAGECAAGGSASPRRGAPDQAFVVTEHGGRWSGAHQAPSGGAGDSAVTLMSCASPLACTAAGYDDNGGGVFVMSTSPR